MLKKRIGTMILTTAVALSLIVTSVAFAGTTNQTDKKAVSKASSTTITREEAKSKVKDRVPKSKIKWIIRGTEYENGKSVTMYKGKATKGNYVYSFEIDKKTGKFIDWEKDYEGSSATSSEIGSNFTKSEAKAKVLKKVPGATIVYIKLTRDDGRWIYEGEAYKKGGTEYSFELNAYNGRIIEWERESVFDD